MRYIKWAIIILFWGTVASVLNYTLPQHDVVRISDTYEKRIDPGENSIFWSVQDVGSDPTTPNRDVFFIQTRKANGKVMVYRNEDTGWGWPPYFKLNSSNLQAEAADLKSTAEAPRWAVVRHYGWRSEFLSIFPNAVKIWQVDNPDVRIIPWFNIIFLTVFFALLWAIWVRWRRFRAARVDPMLENMEDGLYAAGDAIEERSGRFRKWLNSWKSK
ncbi:DUF1523 family protein [Ruegeria lacuscaerulensis]|uniref:DUF1523 family protein n=1 Tax=Ruegeria lacuscaerulensis TaxID=55218 RepID=UPI00147E3F11|nr:DUF1523 family protein [Ruegeria lacuscaerulensis]